MRRRVGMWLVRLDRRRRAVHWVLVRVIPRAIAMRFDPPASDGLEATLELAIRDASGREPARFALGIEGARSVPAPRNVRAARATLGSDDLILLASLLRMPVSL